MLRRDSPTPREHMSERLWMRDRMTLLHSVCHHHEFVKTSHRGSHETCSPQVLTEPNVIEGEAADKAPDCGERSYEISRRGSEGPAAHPDRRICRPWQIVGGAQGVHEAPEAMATAVSWIPADIEIGCGIRRKDAGVNRQLAGRAAGRIAQGPQPRMPALQGHLRKAARCRRVVLLGNLRQRASAMPILRELRLPGVMDDPGTGHAPVRPRIPGTAEDLEVPECRLRLHRRGR